MRSTNLIAGILLALVACGGDATPSADVADAAETRVDVAGDTDASRPTPSDRCCPSGLCGFGEVCIEGGCQPAPAAGQCYAAAECASGQICDAAVVCGCDDDACVPQAGRCAYPAGCCNADGDCGAGELCHEGQCRALPTATGACWTNAQCSGGLICEGGTSCPCGISGCAATPGLCGVAGVCCASDGECGAKGRCVAGSCRPRSDGKRCLLDGDCAAGSRCAGAYLCPCGKENCLVPTTEGVCTAAATCCDDVDDCASSSVCVDGKNCLVKPGGDRCYADGHCGRGRKCDGAIICDCDGLCPTGVSQPGNCRTTTTACVKDADCAAGTRCVIPDRAYCIDSPPPTVGVCVEQVDEGCWSGDDCPSDMRCASERICTDPAGCSETNQPGSCVLPAREDECCNSHRECNPGWQCRNASSEITCPPTYTAVCVPEPIYGETCWNYDDCPPGLVCNGVRLFACGSLTFNRGGFCEQPDGMPCLTGAECGLGYACAKDENCAVNPCVNGTNCTVSGVCRARLPDTCWSHSGCGAGKWCKGLQVCPTDDTCTFKDTPGVCAPYAQSGECCSSYLGCAPGLRCISAATKTGCVLDVSSVCVPNPVFNQSCFSDMDCLPSRTCVGATVCPCGVDSCTTPPKSGTCVLKAP
ncbi:MAG: hypothetical protein R3F39_13015 [Myxococcota bacterium]